jgi:hypothetical protein
MILSFKNNYLNENAACQFGLKRHSKTFYIKTGGRGEIRTHGGLAPTTVFKTVALNRSATLPAKAAL